MRALQAARGRALPGRLSRHGIGEPAEALPGVLTAGRSHFQLLGEKFLSAPKVEFHGWLAKVGPFRECLCGFKIHDSEEAGTCSAQRASRIYAHTQKVEG
jgi:hypothetical protein